VAVAELMVGFGHDWALCGGWAVDSWLERQTREHVDVDLSVFDDDQLAVHAYLRDGWLLNGHDPHDDDSTHPWDGHRLELPAHIHARSEGFNLDFQVNRRVDDAWVYSAEPRLTMPVASVVRTSPWGIPTLAPEAILYYKAPGEIRAHDEADFRALLPTLDHDQRRWLGGAIGLVRQGHPWLELLERV
jgi:hypothetical protein